MKTYTEQLSALREKARQRVLRMIEKYPMLTYAEVSARTQISERTIHRIAAAAGHKRKRGPKTFN